MKKLVLILLTTTLIWGCTPPIKDTAHSLPSTSVAKIHSNTVKVNDSTYSIQWKTPKDYKGNFLITYFQNKSRVVLEQPNSVNSLRLISRDPIEPIGVSPDDATIITVTEIVIDIVSDVDPVLETDTTEVIVCNTNAEVDQTLTEIGNETLYPCLQAQSRPSVNLRYFYNKANYQADDNYINSNDDLTAYRFIKGNAIGLMIWAKNLTMPNAKHYIIVPKCQQSQTPTSTETTTTSRSNTTSTLR